MVKAMTVRIDEEKKQMAEALLNELGISLTAYFNMALNSLVRENRIPFDTSVIPSRYYSEKTLAAMRETLEIENDPNRKGFRNIDDLFKELES